MAVFAVDFDGTIVENWYPEIGRPMAGAIITMQIMKARGHTIIIWTCRVGNDLEAMKQFLHRYQVPYDVINDHAPHLASIFDGDARKIFADYYIDDHNINPWTWNQVLDKIMELPPVDIDQQPRGVLSNGEG